MHVVAGFKCVCQFPSIKGTVLRYKAPDVTFLKTNRKCQRHVCARRRFKRQRTATRARRGIHNYGGVLHQERASTVLGYGESDLQVNLLEGIEAEGSLLVTHEERVFSLTEATLKSGKSVVELLFSPGHSCYFEVPP